MTIVGAQHRQARKDLIMQHRRRLQIFQAAKRAAFYQQAQPANVKEQMPENEKTIHTLEPIHS
ncbi:hypothetical protein BGI39_06610 [Snodgrassella communis]|jgi:hypothetical protein|nr:hypothetical protein BGI31_07000 [Snodgrassella communis]PIT28100.1 hypothetical protein BGI39_06610 [Snodgrassella communis]